MVQKSKVSPIQDVRNLIKNVGENIRKQILLYHVKKANFAAYIWRNTVQPIIAMPEKKGYEWLPNGEIIWVDEAFSHEIEKILQETNDDNERLCSRKQCTE